MPRQASIKTMAVDALMTLRNQVINELALRKVKLEKEMRRLDGRTGKVPATHRGPDGETWAGRGMMPRWLTALLKQGHKADEYLVGVKAAAAAKKSATKKSTTKTKGK